MRQQPYKEYEITLLKKMTKISNANRDNNTE